IALIALPGAAMGASFPVGIAAIRGSGFGIGAKGATGAKGAKGAIGAKGARDVAELYAANTVGAAIGAALTGFVLLPSLGLFGTTIFGVVLNLLAAAGALVLSRTPEPAEPTEPAVPT